ncbi:MAG: ATP-binding cassette domain-containing protein, partial [Chloroflexi bacterium]|nr:ATP-binding cassette domain-containing protein [Chloroflexota bacterium]
MSLHIRGLRKCYGARRALEIASLDVAAGSVALVTGANGAGKSTLLRCVAGVVAHDGAVDRPHGAVAYLPQGDVLPPTATVGEVLRLFGTPPAMARDWSHGDPARRIG